MNLLAREAAARSKNVRFLPPVFVRHLRKVTVAKRPDLETLHAEPEDGEDAGGVT